MKVKKIMTTNIGGCRPTDTLATAVGVMWQKDCGVVPITNSENKVVGIITDRDVAIAVTSRDQKASEIKVNQLINRPPVACRKNDTIKRALAKMRRFKLKRLPVVDKNGKIIGMLSIADVLRVKKKKSLKKQLIKTLEEISRPESILLKEI